MAVILVIPGLCRQFVQVKAGQDLPKEGMEAALDEVLVTYKAELGLTDKEAQELEHLQVPLPPLSFLSFYILCPWTQQGGQQKLTKTQCVGLEGCSLEEQQHQKSTNMKHET